MMPEKIIYRTWHWNWPWDLIDFSSWCSWRWACHGTGKYGWRCFGIVCEYHWIWKKVYEARKYPEDNWML